MIQTFRVFAKGWCQAPAFLNRVEVISLTTTHWPHTSANLTDYNETVVFPKTEGLKMSRAHRVKAEGKVATHSEYLTLQPNPASNYVVASYRVIAGHSASLVLSDATGKQLEVISIKPETNQKVISLARYANGNYVLTLLVDDHVLDSAKLTISH